MSIALQARNAAVTSVAASPTSFAPVLAAHAAGDLICVAVCSKPETGTPSTSSSGWASSGVASGGGGTTGADTGPTKVTLFTKEAASSSEAAPTINCTGINVLWYVSWAVRATAGTVELATAGGADSTAGAAWDALCSTNPGLEAGDLLFVVCCDPTDVSHTYASPSVTGSGLSLSGVTLHDQPRSGTGNDIGGFTFSATVATGPAASNPRVTASVSGTTTNVRGPSLLARFREVSGAESYSGSGALSGSGTLSLSGGLGAAGSLGLSGAGALSAGGVPGGLGTAALSGSGSLQASGSGQEAGFGGTAALSGAGSLGAGGKPGVAGTAALSGAGTLGAAGTPSAAGAVAMGGSGALSAAGAPAVARSLALTGTGALQALQAGASARGTAALSGTGLLTGSGTTAQAGAGSISLSGAGALSLGGTPGAVRTLLLSGDGSLSLTPQAVGAGGLLSLPGTGSLSAAVQFAGARGLLELSGLGVLEGMGQPAPSSGLELGGSGLLEAQGEEVAPFDEVRQPGAVLGGDRGSAVVAPGGVGAAYAPRRTGASMQKSETKAVLGWS